MSTLKIGEAIEPFMWGDIPVPYTAAWDSEWPPTGVKIERVKKLGNHPFMIETVSTPGIGKPLFSTFHVGRAVEVLSAGRCQICLASLLDAQFCIGNSKATILGFPHITDGLPMCGRCTALTLRHCPGLRKWGKDLRVYRVSAFGLAPAMLRQVPLEKGGRECINDALASWGGPHPVYGTPKIYLTKFVPFEPGAFKKPSKIVRVT